MIVVRKTLPYPEEEEEGGKTARRAKEPKKLAVQNLTAQIEVILWCYLTNHS